VGAGREARSIPDEIVGRLRALPWSAVPLRAERKKISREIAGLQRAEVLRLAHHLIHSRVARFVAYELVLNHEPTLASIDAAEVERLGQGIGSWGDVDSFGCYVAGPAWRAGRITDRLIQSWARSEDWCWRRAALVSTVPLNSRAQGGAGDTRRTLTICRMLVKDREDLVVKALSWALRELAKRDPGSVRGFLAEQRGILAARVVREVGNKLESGLKNPRRGLRKGSKGSGLC